MAYSKPPKAAKDKRGPWRDGLCKRPFSFVCKRIYPVVTSTIPPVPSTTTTAATSTTQPGDLPTGSPAPSSTTTAAASTTPTDPNPACSSPQYITQSDTLLFTNPIGTCYNNNERCYWNIAAPDGLVPTISFLSFNILSFTDFLSIFDGPSTDSPLLLHASGNKDMLNVTGTTQYLTVTFQSGSFSQCYSGVTALVSFINDPALTTLISTVRSRNSPTCSGPPFFTEAWDPSVISSNPISTNPYAVTYDNNQSCVWFITMDIGSSAVLEFFSFDTEYGVDFFSVYDGPSTSSPLLFRSSGHHPIVGSVTSSGDHMTVEFTSNSQNIFSGVTAHVVPYFRFFRPTVYCSGPTLIDQAGTILATFTDSDGYYFNDEKCGWLIQAPIGFAPLITFIAFDTEYSFDLVTIYDGPSVFSNMLMSLSGQPVIDPVQASGQFMTMTFTSDGSVTNTGVLALVGWAPLPYVLPVDTEPPISTFSPAGAGSRYCSEFTNITESGTTLSTNPGLPVYADNLRCEWLVTAPVGSNPTINVITVGTEFFYDRFKVFDGPTTTDMCMVRNDGWDPYITSLTASRHYMTILFTSDASIVGTGVEAIITW